MEIFENLPKTSRFVQSVVNKELLFLFLRTATDVQMRAFENFAAKLAVVEVFATDEDFQIIRKATTPPENGDYANLRTLFWTQIARMLVYQKRIKT